MQNVYTATSGVVGWFTSKYHTSVYLNRDSSVSIYPGHTRIPWRCAMPLRTNSARKCSCISNKKPIARSVFRNQIVAKCPTDATARFHVATSIKLKVVNIAKLVTVATERQFTNFSTRSIQYEILAVFKRCVDNFARSPVAFAAHYSYLTAGVNKKEQNAPYRIQRHPKRTRSCKTGSVVIGRSRFAIS